MVITRNWLKNFIDIKGIRSDEITVALNSLGFEVDAKRVYRDLNDQLTLGHVGSVAPIEGTKLNFCFVDKGEDLVSPIVCGANNVKEGQYVIVASPGKTISTGLTLETKEIQGKISEGMICSLTEIGVDQNVQTEVELEGIYPIFTKTDPYSLIGSNEVLNIIGFNDVVWDVDLTLNRSDALGAMQIVKELANYFDKDVKDYTKNLKQIPSIYHVSVSLKETEESKELVRSCAMELFDLKEVHSIHENETEPNIYSFQDIWLKFCGFKSQENFWLDLANVIAIETGQPILFLDPEKLKTQLHIQNNPTDKKPINYQLMCADEVVSTLGVDFNKYFLPSAKSKQVIAVYLSLNPILMRKHQKFANSNSALLQRWIKPISSRLYSLASKRLHYWFDQYNLYSANTEVEVQVEPVDSLKKVEVSLDYINEFLGTKLKVDQVKKLFENLEFKISESKKEVLKFEVDPFRTDISHKAHIIEEIARLYGYNKIESKPQIIEATLKEKQLENKLLKQLENYLIDNGFNNIKTYSLMNKKVVERWDLFNLKDPIDLMSPLSNLRESYRLSIAQSAIEIANLNSSRGNKNLKLYEIADVYNLKGIRDKRLSVLTSGEVFYQKAYNLNISSSYPYLKGILDEVLSIYQIDLNDLNIQNMSKPIDEIHPFINAQVKYKDILIGFIFKLSPRYEQANKLANTFVIELSLSEIEKLFERKNIIKEASKFQKTSRDVTMLLSVSDNYNEVIKNITKDINYLTHFSLLDIYQDETLANEQKSAISVGFEFNSNEKQLTDKEVSSEWQKILDKIKKLKIEVK
ncbi:phenylalanine--tRNA ligase subunit beta [Spiroplasma tabanidicola]|uniref:Phenylalanine--tRNA ligase beta subunit n=1 Tax=Spiroplasma tabanidicola TaxID=324079 RepID=A0A6I6CB51_9MOLU|nr:phenylalanine--tRNA ligase subunit beta [Spiroplasma tabanidicola]QGS52165.1 phenylalanyl-tRNA synthetase subunit beta [Spiroplasma tabanidicola]